MLFMVIERFKPGTIPAIYGQLRDKGRSLPDGLEYVDSWIEASFARCFQLMACDDARLLQHGCSIGAIWQKSKSSPSCPSADTQEVVRPFLG